MTCLRAVLLAASAVLFIAGLTYVFLRKQQRPLTARLLVFTCSIIGAIFLAKCCFATAGTALTPSVLIDIMQAFSLDADYSSDLFGPALFSAPFLNTLVIVYLAVLYTSAPIAGGAIVYDVLAGFSPYIRLALSRRGVIYIFSALNEKTVLLAEDILARKPLDGPATIVFTDAYVDDEQERESELLMRAKALGAICIRDDMLHCGHFRRFRRAFLFLLDEGADGDFDDAGNLSVLCGLIGSPDQLAPQELAGPILSGECDIFVFSNDSSAIESVRAVKSAYDKRQEKAAKNEKNTRQFRVKVIRDWAQTALFLLWDMPLYIPLADPSYYKKKPFEPAKRSLRVAIFGNGPFAEELFKTVYWGGQMWNTRLYITVIGPDDMRRRLDRQCPELMDSCTWKTESGDNPECLRIYPGEGKDAFAEPYCTLSFLEEDIEAVSIRALLDKGGRPYERCPDESYRLADYDYFLIAGSSDQRNIRLTDEILSALTCFQLTEHNRRKNPGPPVIALAVEEQALFSIAKDRFSAYCCDPSSASPHKPVVYPFGDLKSRYTWKSISMDQAYLAQGGPDTSAAHGFVDINVSNDSLYDDWAKAGRIFHQPYRMYSVGMDPCGFVEDEHKPLYRSVKGKLEYYRLVKDHPEYILPRLSWLEHRRWNAFLRVQGFSRPFSTIADIQKALENLNTESGPDRLFAYKDVSLRLHPCLVECDVTGVGPSGDIVQGKDDRLFLSWKVGDKKFDGESSYDYDLLDLVSLLRTDCELVKNGRENKVGKELKKLVKDLKKYDSPAPEVSAKYLPLLTTEEEIAHLLKYEHLENQFSAKDVFQKLNKINGSEWEKYNIHAVEDMLGDMIKNQSNRPASTNMFLAD